jgi:hypothetical protein
MQTAWRKEFIAETPTKTVALIRNEDERAILIETSFYENQLCRECQVSSIHGVLISTHKILYSTCGDPFNGVILYDSEKHPVMLKQYEVENHSSLFTQLLKEEWNMEKNDG